MMDDNRQIWSEYYQKALDRPHLKRTEFALKLNQSSLKVAIDCGCGVGADVHYLAQQGYQVHGFDVNPESIEICQRRFSRAALVDVSQASFEGYDYPQCGLLVANSSLFFAQPKEFEQTWQRIAKSIVAGGVFAGDFMGVKDSWASYYRLPTRALTECQVRSLFEQFDIVRFSERDEQGTTSLGKMKHWHTFSVVALKRS